MTRIDIAKIDALLRSAMAILPADTAAQPEEISKAHNYLLHVRLMLENYAKQLPPAVVH